MKTIRTFIVLAGMLFMAVPLIAQTMVTNPVYNQTPGNAVAVAMTNTGNSFSGTFTGTSGGLALAATNSGASWLTTGQFKTAPGFGLVNVSLIVTNTQIVWLTNATTGSVMIMGNLSGTWTNWDNANLLVNSGDSVCLTNISGTGGAGPVSSYFQFIH